MFLYCSHRFAMFLGMNRGELTNPDAIDYGAATQGTDIELRMDTGKNLTKEGVLLALRTFELYILANGLPQGAAGAGMPPL